LSEPPGDPPPPPPPVVIVTSPPPSSVKVPLLTLMVVTELTLGDPSDSLTVREPPPPPVIAEPLRVKLPVIRTLPVN